MNDAEMNFHAAIRNGLAANPQWLQSALAGVTAGMAAALESANERAADYDLAFRSALSLADPSRLSAGAKEMLGMAVVGAIKKHGGHSPIEDATIERLSPSGV